MAQAPNSAEDFWLGVNRSGGTAECWPWLRKLDAQGRARYRFEGRMRDVHQISFFLEHGVWLRRYDIAPCLALRSCCNLRHLEKRRDITHKALALGFTRMTKQINRQSAFSRYLACKYPDLHWLIQLLGDNAGKFLSEHEGETIKLEMTIPPRSQLIEEARAVDCYLALNLAEPHDRIKARERLQEQYEGGQADIEAFARMGDTLLKSVGYEGILNE